MRLWWLPALLCVVPPSAGAQEKGLADVLLRGVPHVEQEPDFCGEACAEMWLRKLGHSVSQDAVFDVAGVDPVRGRGATTPELAVALQKLGFSVGDVWYSVPSHHEAEGLNAQFAILHADLMRGVPSIVCMHYDESPDTTEHFRLVVGYEARTDQVVYMEPAEAHGGYRKMPRSRFLELWPLKYSKDTWTVIRLELDGTRINIPKKTADRDDAAFAQHVQTLKETLPEGFSIVIERPFVVIGNESKETVSRRAARTIRWTAHQLETNYFTKRPDQIIDIWLFKDAASYESNVKALTGDAPETPYGFYSSERHALFMNIATGGGTLVHEMVHPYVEANVLDAPAWFNEGLASLYEQSDERNGVIIGRTNWRLAGLQASLGDLPSFKELTAMDEETFYKDDRADNYAQARYLFYYLQEKGLIKQFVAAFLTRGKSDPTGYTALKRVLGEKDMAAFQRRWEQWIQTLEFNG